MNSPPLQGNALTRLFRISDRRRLLAFVLMASGLVLFGGTVLSNGRLLGLLFGYLILVCVAIVLLMKSEMRATTAIRRQTRPIRTVAFALMLLSFVLAVPSYALPLELAVLLYIGLIASILSLALLVMSRSSRLSFVFALVAMGILMGIWGDAYAQKQRAIFWIAIVNGDVDRVRQLLQEGHSADARCPLGTTLTAAFRFGSIHRGVYYQRSDAHKLSANEKEAVIADMLLALIENGADVNEKDDHGRTPLHIAVQRNQIRIVQMLIDKGADVNLTRDDHYLVKEAMERIVVEDPNILDHLCNVRRHVNEPQEAWVIRTTPLRIAITMGHEEIACLLRTHGAVEFPADE